MLDVRALDDGIRDLVVALQDAGIQTDWSCSGEAGHLVVRPTVAARCTFTPDREKRRIEGVMRERGITDYWLSLVYSYGTTDTHGGEPRWLIQVQGRFDYLALPVAYHPRKLEEHPDNYIQQDSRPAGVQVAGRLDVGR